MTTAPARPLYVGRFSIEVDTGAGPLLLLGFNCPRCRRRHLHVWDVLPDGSEDWNEHPRAPHCDTLATHPEGYTVAPLRTVANERTYARYASLLATFRAAGGDTPTRRAVRRTALLTMA